MPVLARYVRERIREQVTDQATASALTAQDYPIGAKRICFDTDYYSTYNRDNAVDSSGYAQSVAPDAGGLNVAPDKIGQVTAEWLDQLPHGQRASLERVHVISCCCSKLVPGGRMSELVTRTTARSLPLTGNVWFPCRNTAVRASRPLGCGPVRPGERIWP
jgi:hypothetical protein